jgi:hypothetical protein
MEQLKQMWQNKAVKYGLAALALLTVFLIWNKTKNKSRKY